MPQKPHTFMLRILRRDPDSVTMVRLGEYIAEFAALLGAENRPVFRGIRTRSTGVQAYTSPDRTPHCRARIKEASNDPGSKAARHLRTIEQMLGTDEIAEAQILDQNDNVIHIVFGHKEDEVGIERVYQTANIDGVVTGLVGADDTMHLHLRDHFERDLKIIVRDEELARELLSRFRSGSVRLSVRGTWIRTENGWAPETSKCTVLSFETLKDESLGSILAGAARVKGNGWSELTDPIRAWENIRGLN